MSSFSEQEATAILASYEFAGVNAVVDVGAGHGALLAAILRAHSHISGIAFDIYASAGDEERLLADAAIASRLNFVRGDFFADVPRDGDLYIYKSVLHNWDDDDVSRILRTCRRAVSSHSRLLIVERVIPQGNEASEAKLFDINMLVAVGGRERTEREYEALLAGAGFALVQAIPTASPLTLIEAVPQGSGESPD
jgi:SAM-dependent methyltransferase